MRHDAAYPLRDGWELTHLDPEVAVTEATLAQADWRPARVPGTVQASAFGLPTAELYQGLKLDQVAWMTARQWLYRRSLVLPTVAPNEELGLDFAGLDYRYRILVNGVELAAGEAMFTPVWLPLTPWAGQEVTLLVGLAPPPASKADYQEVTKAKFSSGWDFAPALHTVGIWDEVTLRRRPRAHLSDAWVQTRLEGPGRALALVQVAFSQPAEGQLRVRLAGVERLAPVTSVAELTVPLELAAPALWWPNGLGAPTLHELTVTWEDASGTVLDQRTTRVGLRQITRVHAQGQRPGDHPLQWVINGVPIFVQGVNWVPPDACIGEIGPAHYERYLPAFQQAGVNTIRVWGGGLREKAHFYQRCDELGLLVMQEFPIACRLGMSRLPATLARLRAEASAILRTLRRHPCVVVFTGGNENYHYWEMLDSDEPILREAAAKVQAQVNGGRPFNREWQLGCAMYDEPAHLLLGGLCASLAPHCLYQNTSAMEGEGEVHGIWTWNPRVGDHRFRGFATLHAYWRAADRHCYSEASVAGAANLATIREVLGPAASDAIPSHDDPVWRRHHGFHAAWDDLPDNWLDIPSAEKVFGPLTTLPDLVRASQYLQAEGTRFMIEELRRRGPRCAGFIWWGVNEPWPGLAGNALIDWYGRPKLAWRYLAQAFAPSIVSLAYEELWPRKLRGEFWFCHHGPGPFHGCWRAQVKRHPDGHEDHYEGVLSVPGGAALPVKRLLPLPLPAGHFVTVTINLWATPAGQPAIDAGQPCYTQTYLLGDLRAAWAQIPSVLP